MKTQLYQIISICAITASFVPIILVSVRKLWKEPAFLFIAIYWMLSGFINLIDKIPGITSKQLELMTVVYNMFDIPIVLGMEMLASKDLSLTDAVTLAGDNDPAKLPLLLELLDNVLAVEKRTAISPLIERLPIEERDAAGARLYSDLPPRPEPGVRRNICA